MAQAVQRFLSDCSVVVKWSLTGEPQAIQAGEMFLDWQAGAVEVCAPDLLGPEVMSTLLRACRRGRLTPAEARTAVSDLLDLPFSWCEVRPTIGRALEIALRYDQRAYDCIYVALAEREGIAFWTGDERLYNAVGRDFPFVRWIGDYRRARA
jgi:predicted nucleic acid-binding protein